MKCPKCSYLGFDTVDRCKNCGYDFSLVAADGNFSEADDELFLRPADDLTAEVQWDDSFDQAMTALASFPDISDSMPPTPDPAEITSERAPAEPVPAEPAPTDRGVPLFTEAFDDFGDEPLLKVPATPRPPLAVRRTPRTPRLRVVPQASRPMAAESAMEQWDIEPDVPLDWPASKVDAVSAPPAAAKPQVRATESGDVSGAARRLGAVALDHVLLFAIDLSVMYFTLRMVGLPLAEWSALPLAPLVAFLLIIKLSYFWAFTAVGGQTIGKMATRIRVVTMDSAPVNGSCALTRALAGAVSAALLGLGYLPALAGPGRLALHDYVTHTRVIVLPSA